MTRRFGWKRAIVVTVVAILTASSFLSPWRSTSLTTSSFQSVTFEDSALGSKLHSTNSTKLFNNVVGPDRNRHCTRLCPPNIHNRLVYTCLHPAGLLDRQELLDNLLELASFLCATLEFPTPTQAFHPMHNHHRQVDETLDWSDFFDFSLVETTIHTHTESGQLQGGGRVSADRTANSLVKSVNVVMDPSFYLPWKSKPHCRRPRAAPDRTRELYGLHILSKSLDDVLLDFNTVRQYSFSNAITKLPFLWEIPTNYYAFHKELRAHLRSLSSKGTADDSSCLPWSRAGHYGQRTSPPQIESLISNIWNIIINQSTPGREGDTSVTSSTLPSTNKNTPAAIAAPPPQQQRRPLIGFLHIRRGDTIEECDTSIAKLKTYLSCSFSNMTFSDEESSYGVSRMAKHPFPTLMVLPVTLLVGTNEEAPDYMQALQSMVHNLSLSLSQHGGTIKLQLQAIDMESLIWNHLQSEIVHGHLPSGYLNNLHVFQILEHIKNQLVDFKLVQRRFRYCKDCDPVAVRRFIHLA